MDDDPKAPTSACWYRGCQERIPMLPRYRPIADDRYVLYWITDGSATTAHLLTHKRTRVPNPFRRIFT